MTLIGAIIAWTTFLLTMYVINKLWWVQKDIDKEDGDQKFNDITKGK